MPGVRSEGATAQRGRGCSSRQSNTAQEGQRRRPTGRHGAQRRTARAAASPRPARAPLFFRAYRRATAWSLANYDNQIVLEPLINALKNDVAAVRLWSSSSLAEIGNVSLKNAQLAAEQLLISLKIDNEPGVRSNCIWSLCRLYEKLNNTFQESFVDECTKIALFDKEPSVMEEAKTALDSMGMQGFYN